MQCSYYLVSCSGGLRWVWVPYSALPPSINCNIPECPMSPMHYTRNDTHPLLAFDLCQTHQAAITTAGAIYSSGSSWLCDSSYGYPKASLHHSLFFDLHLRCSTNPRPSLSQYLYFVVGSSWLCDSSCGSPKGSQHHYCTRALSKH